MRKLYFLTALLWVLIILNSCAGGVKPFEKTYSIKFYHTNDIHAHLLPNAEKKGGLAYLKTVIDKIRQQDPEAIIIDAGDFYKKGHLPTQNSNDQVTADLLTQIGGYDLRVVGNNEIKVGINQLIEWSKNKEPAPLLSANFADKNGNLVFKPSMILKRGEYKIGIIGLTPWWPIEKEYQPKDDKLAPYQILDPEESLKTQIKELKPKTDILVLVSHNQINLNRRFAKKYPQLDLVISGHAHVNTEEQRSNEGSLVVEAGQYGQQIGFVNLVLDLGSRRVMTSESTMWPIGPEFQKANPEISEMIKNIYQKWAPGARDVIGQAKTTLEILDSKNPIESDLPNWVVDSLKSSAKTKIGLINRELVRDALISGPITYDDLYLSTPYQDELVVVKVDASKFFPSLSEQIRLRFRDEKLFPFAFSGLKVELVKTKDELSKAIFKEAPLKGGLPVAVPRYLTENCEEYLGKSTCPLEIIHTVGEVRKLLLETIKNQKTVKPPAKRIVVRSN